MSTTNTSAKSPREIQGGGGGGGGGGVQNTYNRNL